MSKVSMAKELKKNHVFSDVNSVNNKTSSTTQVRLGQSMLDNIFNLCLFSDVNGVNGKKAEKRFKSFF